MVAMPIFSLFSYNMKQPCGSSLVMNWKSSLVRFQFIWFVSLIAKAKSLGFINFVLNIR